LQAELERNNRAAALLRTKKWLGKPCAEEARGEKAFAKIKTLIPKSDFTEYLIVSNANKNMVENEHKMSECSSKLKSP
jgi:hypothetical protein